MRIPAMFRIPFFRKKQWDGAIAILEDDIFANNIKKWGSAITDVEAEKKPAESQIMSSGIDATVSTPEALFPEHRKQERFSVSLPVRHKIKGKAKNWSDSQSLDVSQNGLRLAVDEPIPVGTVLELNIKLPNHKKKIKMEGVIIWQKPSWNGMSLWECGVAFENLRTVSCKEKIIDFMADRLCGAAMKETYDPTWTCRPARTKDDLMKVFHLIYQEYFMRHYCKEHPSELYYNHYSFLPSTRTFMLEAGGQLIGTISLIPDSPCGLPVENAFRDKVQPYRKHGRKLAEVGMLALNHRYFGHKSFSLTDMRKLAGAFQLFKIMFDYARTVAGITDLMIVMHPKHKDLYHYLRFQILGPSRSYAGAAGRPGLPMRMDVPKTLEELPKHMNIYNYFIQQMTPNQVLDDALKVKLERTDVEPFLGTIRPIWQTMLPTIQDYFRQSYHGIFSDPKPTTGPWELYAKDA